MIRTAAIILLLCCSVADAQHEPAVRIESRLYCRENVCRTQPIAQGNGVIIGKGSNSLLVITVAHLVEDAQSTSVMIRGKWHPAQPLEQDKSIDIALLQVFGQFDVPLAKVHSSDPPVGAAIAIDGYWPQPWQRRVTKTVRVRSGLRPFLLLRERVVDGVSGAGIVYQGKLAGLVHGVMVQPPYSTLYVPASAIYPRLVQWGYIDQSTPVDPPPKMLVETPITPPVNTCDCDCKAKFAAIESRIETLAGAMKARQDAGDTGTEARKQITALNEQIIILRTELDKVAAKQGPAGRDGTVTVQIVENGKQLHELKNLKPGTKVEVPITRKSESSK
jgi:hypothetical protein